MKVQILAFGITKELIGKMSFDMTLKKQSNVEDLKTSLFTHYPELSKLGTIALAINSEYATDDQIIHEGDEIALIPPVSGG